MDATTLAIFIAIIPASAVIISMTVQQTLGIVRAGSDHEHELKRDHAQRAFEYKRSVLERNRRACTKLQADLEEYLRINRDVRRFERRYEESTTQAERARQENVQYGASEDDEEPFLFEQEEQAFEARAIRDAKN